MSELLNREHRQLAFTFIIVLTLGVFSLQSLVMDDTPVAVLDAGARTPASVSATSLEGQEHSKINTRRELEVNFNCLKEKLEKANVRADFIQLHGRNCLDLKKGSEIEMTNKANGFTASVFQIADKSYQTDIIPLSPGINEISVKAVENDGKSYEYSLEINANIQ
jgi:hypothetical protein